MKLRINYNDGGFDEIDNIVMFEYDAKAHTFRYRQSSNDTSIDVHDVWNFVLLV